MKLPGIPGSIHTKGGRYYLVAQNQWHALSRVDAGMKALLEAVAVLQSQPAISGFQTAINDYLKHHLPKLTPAVRKEHERMFGVIGKAFAAFGSVDQVRPLDVIELLDAFDAHASARQSYKYRLSAFFSWCVVAGLRDTNPVREITVKGPVRRKTPWTDALFLDVREQLDPMMQCYHDLTYLLWQRSTDVRVLERKQIAGTSIRFSPSKTARSSGQSVDITITPDIKAVLETAAEISRKMRVVSPYVIHTSTGTKYTRSGIYSAYRRADEALHGEATGLNPKAIRPYVTTKAEAEGYDMRALQKRLAHANGSTTEGYVQTHSVPVSNIALGLPKR